MILLNALLTPDIGLMFWTLVVFGLLLLILWKFAWKPITHALKAREDSIEKALNEAQTAREEIASLKAENEKIIKEARLERDSILRHAKERGDALINQSREDAQKEGQRIMTETRNMVKKEKEIAFAELKTDLAEMVIDLASKVVLKELAGVAEHKELIEKNLKELK